MPRKQRLTMSSIGRYAVLLVAQEGTTHNSSRDLMNTCHQKGQELRGFTPDRDKGTTSDMCFSIAGRISTMSQQGFVKRNRADYSLELTEKGKGALDNYIATGIDLSEGPIKTITGRSGDYRKGSKV